VGYNGKHSSLLDTTEENSSGKILKLFCGVPTPEENLFHCTHTGKKNSSIVSHNGGKPLSLYPPTEENLFFCIPQRKKTYKLKSLLENKLIRKNLSTHESGSQVEQFDENN
jgi:hypothetical protein